jgi:hypothetical protein
MTRSVGSTGTEENMKTFEEAWAEKEAAGYQYGADALEQVWFGWEIREAAEKEDVLLAAVKAMTPEQRAAFVSSAPQVYPPTVITTLTKECRYCGPGCICDGTGVR